MIRYGLCLCLSAACLAGCEVPQPQNTPVPEVHEVDPATGKGYWLYVPSSYRHDRAMPLIVTCHGSPPFDVANHHIREWKMLCEENGCIVVAPELDATDGILGDGPIVGMLADERYILSLISSLGYRYNIDKANIMITGFSGGGFPTYWVGLRNPEVFSVVAGRNCNFSPDNMDGWYASQARDPLVLIYYGENDPGTIAIQSRIGIQYLKKAGYNVSTATVPGSGHERRPEVAMRFFREHMRTPRASLPTPGSPSRVAQAP